MHTQMSSHADHILSLYLCGYRKGLSAQQARLSLLEKKENIMDKKGCWGAALPYKSSW